MNFEALSGQGIDGSISTFLSCKLLESSSSRERERKKICVSLQVSGAELKIALYHQCGSIPNVRVIFVVNKVAFITKTRSVV